ncbi:MAG TPA: Rieske 2Fe-2S domain-containing protein [Gammaproteobacteria bacterium]
MSDRLEGEPIERRDFLGLAGLWTTSVAIAGALLGMLRLPKPSVLPEASRRLRLGRPEDFPPGSSKVIAGQNVLVVSEPRGVAAVSLVCTHLGCIVTKTERGFSCPCHGSAFDGEGHIVAGPAPRGLRWLQVSQAVDGRLVVNAATEVEPGTYYRV